MARWWALCACLILCGSVRAEEEYPVHPDAEVRAGVPQGELKGPFTWNNSQIYPGTTREYWLYIPAQYDAARPTCLFVVQDGVGRAKGWKLPTVLDNLIHEGAVPPQIGIFISPGVVPAPHDQAQPRFNRSFEYDAVGDRYARFLIDEILPEVGRSYHLSTDPNDAAIAGSSSGAIAAFTVAWERPDRFRRVISTIGTYVDLRNGGEYPTLIRKCEPKPLRIFLQDGSSDNNLYAGSWWVANQSMLSALQFAGYDVNHAWGTGGHNAQHSTAIMPDILRWLWRDYPTPLQAGVAPQRRTDILIPGSRWELVSDGHKFTEGPAEGAHGDLYFTDIPQNRIYRVAPDAAVTIAAEETGGANGLMLGPDGQLYAALEGAGKIVRYTIEPDGRLSGPATVLEDAPSNDLVILANGQGYFTDPKQGKVWWFDTTTGDRQEVDQKLKFPNGVICSPDQTLLTVADSKSRFMVSYQIAADGSLQFKQEYAHLHVNDQTHESGADGLTVDTEGRLYVTSRLGVQVLDQLGRVHLILDRPGPGWLSNVTFAGPDRSMLYATCGTALYRRPLKARGIAPWQAPVMPPKPQL